MQSAPSSFPETHRGAPTLVHAGPLVLEQDEGASQLERYLEGNGTRRLFLVHHGQPRLHTLAKQVGVEDIRLERTRERPEAERVAEVAVALGAEQIEFTIDRPALRNASGRVLGEMTAYEAQALARDPALRPELRAKLLAACAAVQRGVQRARIGSPRALARDRATVIVPDPPFAMGAMLPALDEQDRGAPPSGGDDRPGRHPDRVPARDPERPLPMLARRGRPERRPGRRGAFTPNRGCRIGPRTMDPFADPDFSEPAAGDPTRRKRRMRYA